jgi:hypothetical protein
LRQPGIEDIDKTVKLPLPDSAVQIFALALVFFATDGRADAKDI